MRTVAPENIGLAGTVGIGGKQSKAGVAADAATPADFTVVGGTGFEPVTSTV
jgi:hypothetical protein